MCEYYMKFRNIRRKACTEDLLQCVDVNIIAAESVGCHVNISTLANDFKTFMLVYNGILDEKNLLSICLPSLSHFPDLLFCMVFSSLVMSLVRGIFLQSQPHAFLASVYLFLFSVSHQICSMNMNLFLRMFVDKCERYPFQIQYWMYFLDFSIRFSTMHTGLSSFCIYFQH